MKYWLIFAILTALGCSSSREAPRVQLPVTTSLGLASSTNDLGWLVTVTTARVALANLEFTTEGDTHVASLWERTSELAVPAAYAHPGHLAGGEVIGELPGVFLADFVDGSELGQATLIESHYDGANFTFAQSDEFDGTLELAGVAVAGPVEVSWTAIVTQDLTRTVVGLPMTLDLPDTSATALRLELLAAALFDGVDFGEEPTLLIEPGSANGARLLRAAQRHEFWRVVVVR